MKFEIDQPTLREAALTLTRQCHGQAKHNGWWQEHTDAFSFTQISPSFELAYIAAGLILARPFNDEPIDKDDIYTAGIFDGEGHIGLNKVVREKGFSQYTSRCQVGSTDFELIDHLKKYGGVTAHTEAGKWNENASSKVVWNLHSQQAAAFLARIGPLLRSNRKREAARLVMAVEMSRLPKGGMCRWAKEPSIHIARESAYQLIKRVNSDRSLDRQTLPSKNLESSLADAVIRIFDMSGGLGLDVAGALAEKLEYNGQRADHQIENRRAIGGKKF